MVSQWLDAQDFSRGSEEEVEKMRMERADAALKRHMAAFVKVWRERKRQESMASNSGQVSVVRVKNLKESATNPHCTLSVQGKENAKITITITSEAPSSSQRCLDVQAGDTVELEVWNK